MFKRLLLVVMCCMTFGMLSCANDGGLSDDIVVLFTNDVHCAVSNITSQELASKPYYKSLGYAKIKAYKNLMEKSYHSVLMVDAGDFTHGNGDGETLAQFTGGDAIIDIMNGVGYDYVVLGNHEFTYGTNAIERYMENLKSVFLGCNIVPKEGKTVADCPELTKLNTTYAIKSLSGKKVAFIGVTTSESVKNISAEVNFKFEDKEALKTKVQNQINSAKQEGADYIILIAHLGLDENNTDDPSADRYTSAELVSELKDVDVLLDGHSTLGVGETPAGSSNEDANTVGYILDSEGKKVLYGHTGKFAKKLGKLVLSSQSSRIKEITYLDDYDLGLLEGDGDVEKIVSEKLNFVNRETSAKICDSSATLSRFGMPSDVSNADAADADINWSKFKQALVGETFTGALIADAYRNQVGARIAIVNAGSIGKTTITKSELNLADVMSLVGGYFNKMVTVKLTGAELKQVLAWSAHALVDANKTYVVGEPDADGKKTPSFVAGFDSDFNGFLNVSGLKYTVNVAAEAMTESDGGPADTTKTGRIVNLKVLKTDATSDDPAVDANWEDVGDATEYTVALTSYLLSGDGYSAFMSGKTVTQIKGSDNNDLIDCIAFKNYLANLQTLSNNSVKLGRIIVEKI